MPAECSPPSMQFARLDGRSVVADFGGGVMTSDAGALLLGATDRAIGLVDRFATCFSDGRAAGRVVHDVATLVGRRVFGIALGYEDLIDHDALRHDPVLGVVLGRLEAGRAGCAPLAGNLGTDYPVPREKWKAVTELAEALLHGKPPLFEGEADVRAAAEDIVAKLRVSIGFQN